MIAPPRTTLGSSATVGATEHQADTHPQLSRRMALLSALADPSRQMVLGAALIALVALVLAGLDQGQAAFALSVLAAATVYPAASGPVVRLVLGLFTVLSAYVVVATACDQFHIAMRPAWLAGAGFVFALLAAWRFGQLSLQRREGEGILLAVLALGTAFALPKAFGSAADHVGRLVYGYDNVHHVRYSLAMGQLHGFTFTHTTVPGLYGQTGYRPAQAMLTEFVPWILMGGNTSPGFAATVAGAEVVYTLQLAALGFLASVLLREVLSASRVTLSAGRRACAHAVVTVVVLLGVAPVISQRGFQAQAFATVALLVGLICLCQADRGLSPSRSLVGAAAALVLALNSWPLAGVPLLAVAAFWALQHFRRIRLGAWATVALLAVVATYSIWGPRTFYSDTQWLSSDSPAVLGLAPSTLMPLFAIGGGALVWLARRQPGGAATQVLVAAVVGSALCSAGVAAIQLHNGAGIGGYYLTKTYYAPLILAAVLSAAAIAWWTARAPRVLRSVGVGALSLLTVVAWLPLGSFSVQTYWRAPSPQIYEARAVADAVRDYPAGAPSDIDYVVLGTCRPTASDYTSRWLGTILRSWSPAREVFVNDLGVHGESLGALRTYAAAVPQREIRVYADPACPLARDITAAALPNVTVVMS